MRGHEHVEPPLTTVLPSVTSRPVAVSTPMKRHGRGKSACRTISAMVLPATGEAAGSCSSNTTRSPLPTGMRAPISGDSMEVRNEPTRMSASLWILVAPTSRYGTSYCGFSMRASTRGTP